MITFSLNGNDLSVDADPAMPLLWVIRDIVQLQGTKFGCGQGLCGACTVHLDGIAIRSCITPVSAAKGKQVTTIEGLQGDAETSEHPIQQAWIKNNVPQCGYCQPGQIMSASALLAKNASPTDDDITQAMSGNICRCGTYPKIRQAIHDAAKHLASPASPNTSNVSPTANFQSDLSS